MRQETSTGKLRATDHADPVRLLLGTYLAYILESSRLLVHILGNTYVVCVLLNDYYANSST